MASQITEKDNENQPVFVVIMLHNSCIKAFLITQKEENYSLAFVIDYMTSMVFANTSYQLSRGYINLALHYMQMNYIFVSKFRLIA